MLKLAMYSRDTQRKTHQTVELMRSAAAHLTAHCHYTKNILVSAQEGLKLPWRIPISFRLLHFTSLDCTITLRTDYITTIKSLTYFMEYTFYVPVHSSANSVPQKSLICYLQHDFILRTDNITTTRSGIYFMVYTVYVPFWIRAPISNYIHVKQ